MLAIVRADLKTRKSTALKGVVLKPKSMQSAIPRASHKKDTKEIAKSLRLIRRAKDKVSSIIIKLYRKLTGWVNKYPIPSNKERRLRASNIKFNPKAKTLRVSIGLFSMDLRKSSLLFIVITLNCPSLYFLRGYYYILKKYNHISKIIIFGAIKDIIL